MVNNKDRVTLVRYVFSANDTLFVSVNDLSRYKIDETVLRYIQLCENELQRVYPKAVIEVINSDSVMGDLETYVEAWNDFEESSDSDEITRANEIGDRIFNRRTWYVLKEYIPIVEAKDHSRIPLPVIRWLCANGLLKGASNARGYWELLFEEITQIYDLVTFLDSAKQVDTLSAPLLAASYLDTMIEVPIKVLPEHITFLIATREDFYNTFLEPENSLFLVRREQGQVQISVEHFIDAIASWSGSRWTYPTYVEALGKQAGRRGIKYSYQETERKGKKEIIGISFLLSVAVSQDITLRTLITNILGTVSEIIRDAELALKGGPEWDKIYEKKGGEIRFHKEVLERLLHQMRYPLVLYTHGNRGEYGRDFVFADTTRFQDVIYYGLQAKAGNVSGGANRDVDELITQIERAFMMPVTAIPEKPEVYISTMIIAISGKFTNDAIGVMRKAIPKYLTGCVFFWNREKIISLISQHWKGEND